MDKEKESGKMKNFAIALKNNITLNNAGNILYCFTARRLYNAGYGNVKQAVKEFAEDLIKRLQTMRMDRSFDYGLGYDDARQEAQEKVLDLIKELYGEEGV